MITTHLPVFFNVHLHKRLGPELLEEVIKTTWEDTDTKYLSDSSPAGKLFNFLTTDKDLDFISVLEKANKKNVVNKSGIQSTIEGLFGKIIYDYYRENTFEEGDSSYKKADVYLSKASEIIKRIQEEAYKNWMISFEEIIACSEIDTNSPIVKIGKKNTQTIFKKIGNEVETEESIKQKFTSMFNNLMKSHFSFIPICKKIESMNKLFVQIKNINTTKELKQYMLIYFYDLVYAISITSNFVSFEEAKKIIFS